MSKQLNSILNKLPHAPAKSESISPAPITNESADPIIAPHQFPSKQLARVTAPVTHELKLEIKKYILQNPGETEKSLILKGLRTLGFSIDDSFIEDHRKKR